MHYPYVVSAPQVICGVSQLFRDIVDSRRARSSSYAAVPAFVNFWSLSEYYTSIAPALLQILRVRLKPVSWDTCSHYDVLYYYTRVF